MEEVEQKLSEQLINLYKKNVKSITLFHWIKSIIMIAV